MTLQQASSWNTFSYFKSSTTINVFARLIAPRERPHVLAFDLSRENKLSPLCLVEIVPLFPPSSVSTNPTIIRLFYFFLQSSAFRNFRLVRRASVDCDMKLTLHIIATTRTHKFCNTLYHLDFLLTNWNCYFAFAARERIKLCRFYFFTYLSPCVNMLAKYVILSVITLLSQIIQNSEQLRSVNGNRWRDISHVNIN